MHGRLQTHNEAYSHVIDYIFRILQTGYGIKYPTIMELVEYERKGVCCAHSLNTTSPVTGERQTRVGGREGGEGGR